MNVLIVEDEPVAARRLTDLMAKVAPEANILNIVDSVQTALDWFATNQMPDLVLMDINLADGSCFSIFDVQDITAPIIFCTAYDEYALKAFQSNGIAYLLKPILEADLIGALSKLETLRASLHDTASGSRSVLKSLSAGESGYKSRFLVRAGDKLLPVPASDVTCFVADQHGVRLSFDNGDGHYLDYTITELEALLNPKDFFRVSRQAIVAARAIESATANMRQTRIKVTGQQADMPVSRDRVRAFRAWLER